MRPFEILVSLVTFLMQSSQYETLSFQLMKHSEHAIQVQFILYLRSDP
jgi:hypothetical protein